MKSAEAKEIRKISLQPLDSIGIDFDDHGSRSGQDTMTAGDDLRFSPLRDDFGGERPCIVAQIWQQHVIEARRQDPDSWPLLFVQRPGCRVPTEAMISLVGNG